jgi:hypothetical protein
MVVLFVQWLYFDAPKANTAFFGELITAFFHYFSITLLGRTLFDPWRHDATDMSRLPLSQWGSAFLNNLVSRLIGFLLRIGTILIGLLFITITVIVGALYIVAWYALPILLLLSIFYGFSLMIGGLHG